MMKNRVYGVAVVILACTGMLLFGCSTTKRATRHFNKAYYLSQNVVASGCNMLFPVTSKTEYVKGEDSIVYRQDTVINCDSVVHDTTLINHTVTVRGKDIYHTDTMKVTGRDSAGMQVLYNRIDSFSKVVVKKNAKIDSVTNTRNWLWGVSIGAILLLILIVVFAIKRAMSVKSLI